MSFALSCHTFGEYVDLFDKLQYLIQDKSLIDLRKRKKNSNEPILVSIDLGIDFRYWRHSCHFPSGGEGIF